MGWREELQTIIKDSKLSVSRLKSLSTSLIDQSKKNDKYIDYYVKSIESTIRYCANEHILNVLYAIDLFMKDLSNQQELFEKYKSRIMEVLEIHEKKIMTMIPEEQCLKFIKLLEIWSEKSYFEQGVVRQWLNRMKREMAFMMVDEPSTTTATKTSTTSTTASSMGSNSTLDKLLSKRKHELLDNAMSVFMDIDSDFVNQIQQHQPHDGDIIMAQHIDKKKKDDYHMLQTALYKLSILDLPNELLFNIISNLEITDLIRTSFVSRFFNRFIGYCPFWRNISFENVNNFSEFQVGRILTVHGSQITTLSFNFSWVINRDVITKIATHCTTLTSLSMEKCSLEDIDVKRALMAPNLKHLNLAQNSKLGPNTMVDILAKNKIEKLSIACSHQLIYGLLGLDIYKHIKKSLKSLNIDCYCQNIIHPEYYATSIQEMIDLPTISLEKLVVHHYMKDIRVPPDSSMKLKTSNLWSIVKTNDIVSLREKLPSISTKSLNKRYLNGDTSLFKASEDSKLHIVDLLLQAGANWKINNYYGLSPILVSPNIQTTKVWIAHNIQPSKQLEKDFLSSVPILEKHIQFLRPMKNTSHPTIDSSSNQEFETLLRVLSGLREGQTSEIIQQIKILVSSFLKAPYFFKSYLQSHTVNRNIVSSTIGNDDFFQTSIMPYLKEYQQKRVLLDILESSDR